MVQARLVQQQALEAAGLAARSSGAQALQPLNGFHNPSMHQLRQAHGVPGEALAGPLAGRIMALPPVTAVEQPAIGKEISTHMVSQHSTISFKLTCVARSCGASLL